MIKIKMFASSDKVCHNLFITLKDKSEDAIKHQLELGKKYLTNHPGQISFQCGVLAKGLTRHKQVSYLHNETDFTVAFQLIFADNNSHNIYQNSDRHTKHFIPESKSNWSEIRVFDYDIK